MNTGIILFTELHILVVVRSTSVKQRCVESRMNEHGTQNTEPMLKHLSEWQMFKETCNLFALPSVYNKEDQNKISMTPHMQWYKILRLLALLIIGHNFRF